MFRRLVPYTIYAFRALEAPWQRYDCVLRRNRMAGLLGSWHRRGQQLQWTQTLALSPLFLWRRPLLLLFCFAASPLTHLLPDWLSDGLKEAYQTLLTSSSPFSAIGHVVPFMLHPILALPTWSPFFQLCECVSCTEREKGGGEEEREGKTARGGNSKRCKASPTTTTSCRNGFIKREHCQRSKRRPLQSCTKIENVHNGYTLTLEMVQKFCFAGELLFNWTMMLWIRNAKNTSRQEWPHSMH